MRSLQILLESLLAAGLAAAQIATPILPPGIVQPAYKDLQTYLSLTDTQLQSLEAVQNSRAQAEQAIYQQISQKYQQINALLQSGSKDAVTIGQLTIDINTLQKQIPIPEDPYRTQALAVLTPDQKNKLAGLVSAQQLQSPAWQAVSLNLIDGTGLVIFPVMPPIPAAGASSP